MSKSTVTAAEVREFYRADEKRMARLSPEAQATVREGSRGRLHAEVVKDHNKSRRTRQYVSGASNAAKAEAVAQAQALRAQAAEAGFTVGKRGPLPKEFLATLKG